MCTAVQIYPMENNQTGTFKIISEQIFSTQYVKRLHTY